MGEGKRKDQVRGYEEKISIALDEDINNGDILTDTRAPSEEILIECELSRDASCPDEGEMVRLLDRKTKKIEVVHGTNIIGWVSGTGNATLLRSRPSLLNAPRGAVLKAKIVQPAQFSRVFWVKLV